ncbi:NAD+ synthase [Thermasporomyces composti]|uniref:Glutamine-dependent NAD(+) synthetase n=1 Tax=Thermasporomyces composti TaxID=696763 RepID=A0A3D9V9X5_THECX|nr:NAD+ synthase [Thermasporomyces composti]REF34954.1 NAD+ synthase (glutamine-hydrolysing) [Thermasporomyces composti]
MAQIRLALAQLNVTVGDIAGNADAILRWAQHAADRGAHVVAFPEMALTGYPVEDLALRTSFVDASRAAMDDLAAKLAAAGLGNLTVICGYLDRDPEGYDRLGRPKGSPQNAAAIVHGGRVVARAVKHHLPNYGVFDEYRYFVPGDTLQVVTVHGIDIAVVICEDLWQEGGPVRATRAAGAGLLLAINASPYERTKDDERLKLVTRRAREAMCPLAYVNMVGGQDELVFDGDSIVVDESGTVVTRAPQFSEGLLTVDLDLAGTTRGADEYAGIRIERTVISDRPLPPYQPARSGIAPRLDEEAEIYTAIVTGLRDYVEKNGHRSVVVGLSGGIDSALTATIACDALGPENVYGVSNPSKYSSEHSKVDAAELAERTGLNFRVIPIEDIKEAFLRQLPLTGVADENLQARIRGMIWMSIANQEGHLVLASGNKSELAVGYSTIYGDAVGAYAPLKDVPKTWVWRLARWRNQRARELGETPPIPERSITKEPSAELRPGQRDTDSLPPYEVLDDVLDDYVEQDASAADLVAAGFDPDLVERVIRMVDAAEFKRRQYPPGPKITFKAFGRDRRLPLTNRWRESVTDHQPSPAPARAASPGEGPRG